LGPAGAGKAFSQSTLFGMDELPHPVLEELRKLDLMHMTPVQAMVTLHELQKKLGLKEGDGEEGERPKEVAR